MKEFNFQIDGGKKYAGFSQNEYWNGWACPLFTFEVALEIASEMNTALANSLVYDDGDDSFVARDDSCPSNEWERFKAVVVGAKKLYPIGSHSWIWDEVD
eukprot:gene19144-27116_t